MTLSLSDVTGKQTSSLVVEAFDSRYAMTTAVERNGRMRRLVTFVRRVVFQVFFIRTDFCFNVPNIAAANYRLQGKHKQWDVSATVKKKQFVQDDQAKISKDTVFRNNRLRK